MRGQNPKAGPKPDAPNAGPEPDAGPKPDTVNAGSEPDVGPEPNVCTTRRSCGVSWAHSSIGSVIVLEASWQVG
ncbi:hypothetical protein CRG98_018889 [Punica granatum]|uniref:Uncharacterized protein n=1 Tax=Punica granatum TaxID=22663 RepID=A0A2I0JWM6_PUNGR|nr:hypothetical protein CRG98_018889 [Punica granatum]